MCSAATRGITGNTEAIGDSPSGLTFSCKNMSEAMDQEVNSLMQQVADDYVLEVVVGLLQATGHTVAVKRIEKVEGDNSGRRLAELKTHGSTGMITGLDDTDSARSKMEKKSIEQLKYQFARMSAFSDSFSHDYEADRVARQRYCERLDSFITWHSDLSSRYLHQQHFDHAGFDGTTYTQGRTQFGDSATPIMPLGCLDYQGSPSHPPGGSDTMDE
ncbi:hypothetical protein Tco_0905548 [Tanacetum coccineum]